ncbi:hypothetical protein VCHA53O480_400006 [Vibrio chagasii]|nr:hypothetical protein VCHA31O73_380020 [Vibrio chagasii]CAH7160205.1 hypothetical protein VCHA37P199_230028 [Vibrio chagasii]CAH7296167.1 hypothetical protein VCHA53O480_400006 [Vibrio chagasii]
MPSFISYHTKKTITSKGGVFLSDSFLDKQRLYNFIEVTR